MALRSRVLLVFVTLLALVLVGTVIVLSTVVKYFGIDQRDVITEVEMRLFERLSGAQAGSSPPGDLLTSTAAYLNDSSISDLLKSIEESAKPVKTAEEDDDEDWSDSRLADLRKQHKPRIPRIIHQTWKSDTLPERWEHVRRGCLELHPDYEYKLWTDESSRDFIAEYYPWFLKTFDGYRYPIQRADVIRYFVLHHYGGIYMDLDIGCKRNMEPLLYFPVVLPVTIPVGVSNDLMLAEKGHPFMDLVIHNLITFDHQYGTNYPTVMFSTGPMFLSAQYGLYPRDEAIEHNRPVRILPKRWYGKNAPVSEMRDSFFIHFYGSSWHADDAGFITFLGKFGMVLMYLGVSIVLLGTGRLLWAKARSITRPNGPIALPLHLPSDDRPAGQGRGALYYVPVWLLPNGETHRASDSSWTFWPRSSDRSGEGYQPVPSFSRPPSPSNDSILHAPGAHDGAFDGVNLHSVSHSDGHVRRVATVVPPSPPPPAYNSLRGWGSQFFRTTHSGVEKDFHPC